ncbi:hypothetical protein [Pseudomarimonas arenosa]|uniref:Uncharacterized protein n=1 Tax=Pseudomarimonas arenosa TaxID=2774145 RepID=A0AAW3ZHX5_9GAMM|nr:hypothetical protein [Pseudomarimonas arenosa]MBD8524545.1 hypothetical protein [Pseudomarimonas arenosa]
MWYRLKNSLQAATLSLAVVFALMAAGHFQAAPEATASLAPTNARTLTGMTPEAEQLVIALAAKVAAAAIDEALADQPTAMRETADDTAAAPEPPRSARSRSGLRQRIPFFSFAARPARTQGS